MNIADSFNYWAVMVLMMSGLYILIAQGNLVKKVIGLTIFQTSVFILYISMANIIGATAPVLSEEVNQTDLVFSNPLPHVMILTAIVVGISTTALALSLIIRIKRAYDTIEEDEIHDMDAQ
ncbi:cation:proton antiporter subunit C [Thalassotalea fusca]